MASTFAAAAVALALACGDAPRPAPVASAPPAIGLAATPFASLSLEVPLPYGPWSQLVEVPINSWKQVREDATSRSYEAILPEPVPIEASLVRGAPEGAQRVERLHSDLLTGDANTRSSEGTWSLLQRRVVELTLPARAPAPQDETYAVVFAAVTERERSWLFDGGRSRPVDAFVRRQVEVDRTTRNGLLLPAPARVSWRIQVPPAAELSFAPGLLPPDWRHLPKSNGALLSVDVRPAQTPNIEHRVYSEHIRDDAFELVRLDLSAFAGQSVELVFDVDPKGSTLRDYVFVAEPVVAARLASPRRAIVLFVDTLRSDRLGIYGNERETSPAIDRWAEQGAVFEQARSVAPWTLPSVRSLLTGRAPEAWDASQTLPGVFSEHGFATSLFGANNYLLSNFGMARDWDEHRVRADATATEQTDRALRWLDQHEGRDALLVVHYMDPHLPYREPAAYRGRFDGGPEPAALAGSDGVYSREEILRATQGGDAAMQQRYASHLLGRYDANVRYVDDEIARLLEVATPDDLVVLVSDHGEEFFDQGGFEHGHAFGESVMRIPLIFAGRGVARGRYSQDVSILDVMPTLVDAFGLEGSGAGAGAARELGRSLWPLLGSGEGVAGEPRSIAFGRPLHGPSGWGVVRAGEKYLARAGVERRSRVSPSTLAEEATRSRGLDPAQHEPMRALLPAALDRDFVWAWRLALDGVDDWPAADVTRSIAFAGGIERAWVGADPTLRSSVALELEGESAGGASGLVAITWRAGYRGPSEVFVVGSGGPPQLVSGAEPVVLRAGTNLPFDASGADKRVLHVSRAWVPVPLVGATEIVADDPELRAQLRALGYLVGEDAPAPAPRPE